MFLLPLVIISHSSKVRLLDFFSFFLRCSRSASHQRDRVSRASSSDLLKEYRKVDDAVTTRINRTTAQFRDRDRLGASGKGSVQEQACAHLWKELVGARGQNPIITRRLDVFHGPSQLETPS